MRIRERQPNAFKLRALLIGALLSLTPACGASLSQIETGKVVKTNEAAYDDFFKAVVTLSEDTKRAEAERKTIYADLAKALSLAADADAQAILASAKETAKKLDTEGTSLHLELAPEPKLCVLTTKRTKGSVDIEAFTKAIDAASKASITLTKRMTDNAARARELDKQRIDLASKPAAKKGDIEEELAGAQKVLAETRERATQEEGLLSAFLVSLTSAVETGAVDLALARFTGKTPKAAGGKPGGGAAQGSAAPKPKPSDDFEP